MSAVPSTSTSHSSFASIFNTALESYKCQTKKDLASHPLLPTLQSCDSPEAILTVLREQIPAFKQSQNSDDGLTKWVTPTVNVLYAFSATVGQGVGLVNIRIFFVKNFDSNICFFLGIPSNERNICGYWRSPLGQSPSSYPCAASFNILHSQTAKDASASRDKLIELFSRIEHFFRRLEIYTDITPTTAMTDIIIEIMVEVLTILAIATKEVKRGRISELVLRRFRILG